MAGRVRFLAAGNIIRNLVSWRSTIVLFSLLGLLLLTVLLLKTMDSRHQDPMELLLHYEPQVRDDTVGISRRIHQSWKSPQLPSARAARWVASWRACYPDWKWKLWTDADNLRLVQRHYPWLLETYLLMKQPVQRADIVRYLYLHRYGGIYTDLDTICLRNFTNLFDSAAVVICGMEHNNARLFETIRGHYVQNSLMASRPGHPFWLRLVLRAVKMAWQQQQQLDTRPEYITGPLLLLAELKESADRAGIQQRADGAVKIGSDILILPGRYLNPFSWSVNSNPANCRDLGNMTAQQEASCVASFPKAYAIQFHTQSWLNGHF